MKMGETNGKHAFDKIAVVDGQMIGLGRHLRAARSLVEHLQPGLLLVLLIVLAQFEKPLAGGEKPAVGG